MNIKEIVEKYLKDHSYDGLCNPNFSCGCGLKDGLFPCDDLCGLDCVPAMAKIATKEDVNEESDFKVGDKIFVPAENKEAR
jgi:hypothetical protein